MSSPRPTLDDPNSIVLDWSGKGFLVVFRQSDGTIPVVVVRGQMIISAQPGEVFDLTGDDHRWEVRYQPGETVDERDYGLFVKNAELVSD